MLNEGAPFPATDAVDETGRPFRLDGPRARPLVLYFLRSTSCPVCLMHVRALLTLRDDLSARGVDLAFVVPESSSSARAWAKRRASGTAVLTAAGAETIHRQVGLNRRMARTMQQSGTALIDANGDLRHLRVATVPTAGFDRSTLDRALEVIVGAPA